MRRLSGKDTGRGEMAIYKRRKLLKQVSPMLIPVIHGIKPLFNIFNSISKTLKKTF